MKTFFSRFCLAMVATCAAATVQAQLPVSGLPSPIPQDPVFHRSGQLLGLPTSDCRHVIDMMMQHRIRQQTGQIGTPSIRLPHLTVDSPAGDLALCGVHEVTPATGCAGPVLQVTLQNNSVVPIGNFWVTIVGVLGRIDPASPTAEHRVDRMEPGQQLCVTLQLPVTCMNLGPVLQRCPFDTLVVAVDSRDCLLENNEVNNLQVLPRQSIPSVVQPVPQEISEGTPPAQIPVAPAAPVAPGDRDPLQNSDLDQQDPSRPLDLQLRFRSAGLESISSAE